MRTSRYRAAAGVVLGATLLAACTVKKQETPGLTGPSELGTALTISVQERRKELALRRALGVTQGGLQGGVIAEAIMLALVGVIGGGVLGFGYAEIAILATGIDMSLPGLSVVLPLVIGAAAVVLLAVLAAFGPSRGASRIRPAAGLASG